MFAERYCLQSNKFPGISRTVAGTLSDVIFAATLSSIGISVVTVLSPIVSGITVSPDAASTLTERPFAVFVHSSVKLPSVYVKVSVLSL